MDCVSDGVYEHCVSGTLIINPDQTFTSTILITRRDEVFNLTLPLYSLNGQGSISLAQNSLNICDDNGCEEFMIENNQLIHSYQTVGCGNTVIFGKQ